MRFPVHTARRELHQRLAVDEIQGWGRYVRSVWLCWGNDALGNVAVMIAALAVYWTVSAWPDLIVAAVMAGLFLWSAAQILRQAMGELREVRTQSVPAE